MLNAFLFPICVIKRNLTLVQIVSTPIDKASPTLNELNVVFDLTTPSYEEFAICTVCSVYTVYKFWNKIKKHIADKCTTD